MKRCPLLAAIALLAPLCFASRSFAQAEPTAHRGGELQAGLAFSNGSTDEVSKRIGGASAFADFDLTPHFGLEADVHLLDFFTPQDYAQQTYLAGGRAFIHRQRYTPYVKVLGGLGRTVSQSAFSVADPDLNEAFGVLALGGGLDIRIPHQLIVRAVDFEYQLWPSYYPNGLNPTVLSFGLAYRIR